MERFLVLFTTTESRVADASCEALEDAGIPVMIEHVDVLDQGSKIAGFRLLVPSHHSQEALKVAKGRPEFSYYGLVHETDAVNILVH
jgi:hypothetical protein